MRHEQLRCSCCGEVYGPPAAGEGATVLLWSDWSDLPAFLRPGGPARPVCHSGQRERAKTLRQRRAEEKRARRAARRA